MQRQCLCRLQGRSEGLQQVLGWCERLGLLLVIRRS